MAFEIFSGDGLLLQELTPFVELGKIAEQFDVELTLFGGSASRSVMRLFYRPGEDFDIFDLTPFTSDIDLAHSGTKQQTGDIRAAILDRVPFASWCRWAVVDAETYAKARENVTLGVRVPLREISFSTRERHPLNPEVLRDLEDRQVSWSRNPEFSNSSYAREGKTIEIFGLMMALNVEADMADIAGKGELRDEILALEWLTSSEAYTEAALVTDENAALQCRAWHLAAVRRARGVTGLLDTSIQVLMGHFPNEATGFGHSPQNKAISVTKRSLSGNMRVPETEIAVISGADATGFVEDRLHAIAKALSLDTLPEIDPCYEVLAVFRNLTVMPTAMDKAEKEKDSGAYASAPSGEFIQLAWPANESDNVTGITGFYLPASDDPATIAHAMSQPTPLAIGGKFDSTRCWLRVDIETLAYRNETMPREIPIDVVALAPRINREENWLEPKLVAPSDDSDFLRRAPANWGEMA